MITLANNRIEQFDKTVKMNKEAHELLIEYWKEYSLYASLEYWIMASFLIVPLIVLFFKIDKERIFLIGFFGYSIHVLFAYVDAFGRNMGLWNYPLATIPIIPGIALDSSLIPVTFMLVYQWTLRRNKNYYIYALLTAIVFAFAFKPMLVALGMFKMYGKITYIHLFIGYIVVLVGAKFITNIFLWTQKKFAKAT